MKAWRNTYPVEANRGCCETWTSRSNDIPWISHHTDRVGVCSLWNKNPKDRVSRMESKCRSRRTTSMDSRRRLARESRQWDTGWRQRWTSWLSWPLRSSSCCHRESLSPRMSHCRLIEQSWLSSLTFLWDCVVFTPLMNSCDFRVTNDESIERKSVMKRMGHVWLKYNNHTQGVFLSNTISHQIERFAKETGALRTWRCPSKMTTSMKLHADQESRLCCSSKLLLELCLNSGRRNHAFKRETHEVLKETWPLSWLLVLLKVCFSKWLNSTTSGTKLPEEERHLTMLVIRLLHLGSLQTLQQFAAGTFQDCC